MLCLMESAEGCQDLSVSSVRRVHQYCHDSISHRILFLSTADLSVSLSRQSVAHLYAHTQLLYAELYHALVGHSMEKVNSLLSRSVRLSHSGEWRGLTSLIGCAAPLSLYPTWFGERVSAKIPLRLVSERGQL